MNQVEIGKYISNLRKRTGLNQSDFGEMFSVSDKAVSNWENGKSLPDIQILYEIANKYDLTINDILECNYNKKDKSNYIYFINSVIIIICFLISLIIILNNIPKNTFSNDYYNDSNNYSLNIYQNNDLYYFNLNYHYDDKYNIDVKNVNLKIKYQDKIVFSLKSDVAVNLYNFLTNNNIEFKIRNFNYDKNIEVVLEYIETNDDEYSYTSSIDLNSI